MSKKNKHQKQVNNTQEALTDKKTFHVPETTLTFDDMFSSALQKMLEEPQNPKTAVEDGFPVLELPAREKTQDSSHRKQSTEQQERAASNARSEQLPSEDDEADVQKALLQMMHRQEDRPEKELLPELLHAFSDSPLNDMALSAAAPMPHNDSSLPAPLEETEPEMLLESHDLPEEEAFLDPPELPGPSERFDTPEVFVVPRLPELEKTIEAPEVFSVPQIPNDSEMLEEPERYTVPDDSDEHDNSLPPEVFTVPNLPEDSETLAIPEHYAVPEAPKETEVFEAPEVFTVPKAEESYDLMAEGQRIILPLPIDESKKMQAEIMPKSLHRKKSKEKKRPHRRRAPKEDHSKAQSGRTKQPERNGEQQPEQTAEQLPEQTAEQLPEQIAEQLPEQIAEQLPEQDWNMPDEDTASLLAVINSLICETAQAAEAQPEKTQPKQKEAAKEDTIRFALPYEKQEAPESEPLSAAHTVRLGWLASQEAQPVPERNEKRKAEAPERDFWDEFAELKTLVGERTQADFDPKDNEKTQKDTVPSETTAVRSEQPADPQPASKQMRAAKQRKGSFGASRRKPKQGAGAQRSSSEQLSQDAALKENDLFGELEEGSQNPVMIQSADARAVKKAEPIPERTNLASIRSSVPQKRRAAQEPPARTRPRNAEQHQKTQKAAVLSPEQAYRIHAKQLGTTGTRLAASVLLCLVALFLTIYASCGWTFLPLLADGAVMAYLLLGLMLVSAALAYDVFANAMKKLRTVQFSAPILVALAGLAVTLDTLQAAADGRVPFCVAVSILCMLLLWNQYDAITGILTTLQVLRDANHPTGIVEVPDVMRGRVGLSRADGSVDDFMEKFEITPPTDKLMQIYVPVAALAGIIISAIVSAKGGVPFLWAASLMLLGSIPLIGILNYNRLFCILAKRLSDSDAALCGWYGAQTFGGDHSILVSDCDLFPEKNIKLNGIKVIAKDADRVIAYAAATAKAAGSALSLLFEEELRSRNARHYRVERCRFYESGGIGAEIAGDIVLMGTLDFMKRMGVHMEAGMKLRQAVYTSVNGELAAVFAIKYTPKDSVRRGLAAIADNRHFKTVFVTRDFLMTPEMIRDKYEISLNNTLYPPAKERIRLSEAELREKGKQGALMANDSFGSFADAAAGGRVLKSAVKLSVLLTLLNGLLGIMLMAVLAFRRGFDAATAVNLLLYQLSWMIPTLFLTGWTRRY